MKTESGVVGNLSPIDGEWTASYHRQVYYPVSKRFLFEARLGFIAGQIAGLVSVALERKLD